MDGVIENGIFGVDVQAGLIAEEIENGNEAEGATLEENDEGLGDVWTSVSHNDILSNLRPWEVGSTGSIHKGLQANRPKKSKDRVLKEIMNKLKVRPINLKPSRAGSKSMGNSRLKN